jgi:hypothetical protein
LSRATCCTLHARCTHWSTHASAGCSCENGHCRWDRRRYCSHTRTHARTPRPTPPHAVRTRSRMRPLLSPLVSFRHWVRSGMPCGCAGRRRFARGATCGCCRARRARGVPVLRRWAVSVPVPSLCTLTRPEARFRATPLEAHSARCSACAARARVLSSLANAPAHVRGRQERTGAGRGVGRAGHAEHWPIQHARTHARTHAHLLHARPKRTLSHSTMMTRTRTHMICTAEGSQARAGGRQLHGAVLLQDVRRD